MDLFKYNQVWLEHNFLDEETLQEQLNAYKAGQDSNLEHYRYLAFRKVLQTRSAMSNEQIAHYIMLAQVDDDAGVKQAALCDLIDWGGLRIEQLERLSQNPLFALPLFQKRILRKQLFALLKKPQLTPDTFNCCIASMDTVVQKSLAKHLGLTRSQIEILAEKGANRSIRNIAKARLQNNLSDTRVEAKENLKIQS